MSMQNATLLMLLHTRADKSATSDDGGDFKRNHQVNDIQWACKEIETFCHVMGPGSVGPASLYASQEEITLIIALESSQQTFFSQKFALWNEQQPTSTRWRLYELLKVPIKAATASFHIPHIIVCVSMTPAPQNEDDFNNWYNEEHISLLSRTPTWMESTRYRLINSNDNAPRYLAMHKWENRSALGSPEHKVATTTPWRYQVVNAVVANQRHIYDYNLEFSSYPIASNSIRTKGNSPTVFDAK